MNQHFQFQIDFTKNSLLAAQKFVTKRISIEVVCDPDMWVCQLLLALS